MEYLVITRIHFPGVFELFECLVCFFREIFERGGLRIVSGITFRCSILQDCPIQYFFVKLMTHPNPCVFFVDVFECRYSIAIIHSDTRRSNSYRPGDDGWNMLLQLLELGLQQFIPFAKLKPLVWGLSLVVSCSPLPRLQECSTRRTGPSP